MFTASQIVAHLWGDYILQSDWMAQNKTKRFWPAFVHALFYSLCFVWLCWVPAIHIAESFVPVPSGCPTATPTAAVTTELLICSQLIVSTPSGRLPVSGTLTVPASDTLAYFRWLPWLVIFSTHFFIDRYRLARYVVWAKNWLGPLKKWGRFLRGGTPYWTDSHEDMGYKREAVYAPMPPFYVCTNGYPPTTPVWLSTWLLIIADNILHITINGLALRYL